MSENNLKPKAFFGNLESINLKEEQKKRNTLGFKCPIDQ